MVSTGVALTALLGIVAGLFGVLSLRSGYARKRRAERTANTESRSVAELSPDDGRVSIEGTVESAGRRHTAHVADGEGVVVHTEAATYNTGASGADVDGDGVDEMHTSNRGSYDYRQEDVRAAPFVVDDGTGTVGVVPDGDVDAVIDPDGHVDVEGGDPPEPVAEAVDAADDIILGSQTDRLREGVLGVGDEVTVQGVPATDGGRVELAPGSAPMLISDGPVERASDEQAEGWIGYTLIGLVLLAVGAGIGYLLAFA